MAIRTIREVGDPILGRVSRPVTLVTPRIRMLVKDMLETMYEAGGVGLAAPQVGILRRIVVIDVDGSNPYILINPEIVETEGEQTGNEGCLSIPGKIGTVTRPMKVRVRAMDLDMKPYELEAEEFLARAVCHECDHLDGILYAEKAEGPLVDVQEEPAEEEGEEE